MNAWLKPSLAVAAIANLAAALLFAAPDSTLARTVGLPGDVPALYALLAAWMVALFGIVYVALARQTEPNRSLLALGATGKAGFFLIAAVLWLAGDLSVRVVLLAAGDLAFALYWGLCLAAPARRVA